MRYASINALRLTYPVRLLCRLLRVSPSGYYAWNKRPIQAREEERLVTLVKAAHQKTRGTYGAVRLHQELLAQGHTVSLWKVKQIRRKHRLVLQRKRKFVRTTDSNHSLPVAHNILAQSFIKKDCNLA